MKRRGIIVVGMTLFLIINILMMISCGSGGPGEQRQVTKADGTVIDLAKVSKKIKNVVDFASRVKEVHALVKSIDELAKAIGKKISDNGIEADSSNKDNNGFLLSGAYQIIDDVKVKLGALEEISGVNELIKKQITDAKSKSESFLSKLKEKKTDLGKKDASEDNAKKAINRNNTDKSLGAQELIGLNTAIDSLLKSSNDAVVAAITELTTPIKPSND